MKRTSLNRSTKPMRNISSKRAKACAISTEVKREVWERDLYSCVWTCEPVPMSCACAHYVRRSRGGLGIPQNILTLSPEVHERFDSGTKEQREEMKDFF